ncbi:MAG: hypothetical protein HY912_20795 [Desulfomonile tiedjei]|uniref:Uncharacterized protein n=1 Tax=Desulfomonile tiedjei TaxID=2358 RepID=A0A9D6Z293_9BACT|nr:hypothetical protein [Desulfomonile tiedjei]
MKHNKPRFRLRRRIQELQRRRTAVEFMAGFPAEPFYYFKKRMPINNRLEETEEDPSTRNGEITPDHKDPA